MKVPPHKPTVKSNSKLGKALHNSLERNSRDIKEATSALGKQSGTLLESIIKSFASEEQNLKSIDDNLEKLNKTAKDYKEKKELLVALRRESVKKLDSLEALEKNTSVTTKLTQTLLSQIEQGKKGQEELLADKIYDLNVAAQQLNDLGGKTKFDGKDLVDSSSNLLDKRQKDALEKKIRRTNKLYDLGHKSGAFGLVVDQIAGSLLGPLGKPLVDTFNLTEKLFDNGKSAEKKRAKLEAKQEEKNKKLMDKVDASTLSDEDKALIKSQYDEKEKQDEIEIDRTQDFRAESISLQKKSLDKADNTHFGMMELLTLLTSGKLLTSLVPALAAALGPNLLKVLGRGAGVGVAWEGGQLIGQQIEKILPQETKDAIGFGVGQVVDSTLVNKDNFMKGWNDALEKGNKKRGLKFAVANGDKNKVEAFQNATVTTANNILSSATTSFNAFNNSSFNYLNELNSMFLPTGADRQNDLNMMYSPLKPSGLQSVPMVAPRVDKVPLPQTQQQMVLPDGNKTSSTNTGMNSAGGKISMDDISMFSKDQSLMAITTGMIS